MSSPSRLRRAASWVNSHKMRLAAAAGLGIAAFGGLDRLRPSMEEARARALRTPNSVFTMGHPLTPLTIQELMDRMSKPDLRMIQSGIKNPRAMEITRVVSKRMRELVHDFSSEKPRYPDTWYWFVMSGKDLTEQGLLEFLFERTPDQLVRFFPLEQERELDRIIRDSTPEFRTFVENTTALLRAKQESRAQNARNRVTPLVLALAIAMTAGYFFTRKRRGK